MNHPEVQSSSDAELGAAHRAFISTLRDGVAAAQAAGWHPEADPEALVTFSIAGAMGAASLLGDERYRRSLGVEDGAALEALADAVLDLVVHRNRTVALPAADASDTDSTQDRRAS